MHTAPDPTATAWVDEARFRHLFDEVEAVSIQGYLPDGTVVYWNRASENIYGYKADEALGRNLLDLIIPPAMREEVQRAVRWMFDTGTGIPAGRLVLQHKDGRPVHVHSSHALIQVPGHSPVLFCLDADMSALADAENELRIAATAFETQQAMLITDPQGRVLRINPAFTRVTGFGADDAVDHPMGDLHMDRHTSSHCRELQQALARQGSWEGEIWHRRREGEPFSAWVRAHAVRAPDGRITHHVCTLTDLTQRREAQARITDLAYYDPLTHLPNRRLLHDRLVHALATARRYQRKAALLFIDLDHFQTFNDTHGHAVGDQLLQVLAERMARQLRESDTLARFGGDEFVVLIEGLDPDPQSAAQHAQNLGEQLLGLLSQPVDLGTPRYQGTASIGVTVFPGGTAGPDELLKQADLAMFESKSAGRHTLRFYDDAMQARLNQRTQLIDGLQQALAQSHFELHYQPQVNDDGRPVGLEALLRWRHPTQGLLLPGAFIALAEETGLIRDIGRWVLEQACQQLVRWSRHPALSRLTVSVNVSAPQWSQGDLVAQVADTLARTGANPQHLQLELTESLLIQDIDAVVAKAQALKALGVQLSLDDFGTGYSSLWSLHRLPVDELKIDRSFVQRLGEDEQAASIVQTILSLAATLRLRVVAEGVETRSQLEQLQALGCHCHQGYHFARPMPADAVPGWVSRADLG
ncbi:bifunctional diguanylate cyclase/phosphodiesterase [Aquabacterium sp. A08]|uniref:sensor domain-containing protein n=1 Tax=Aquabacterium sp. A08 TaxID=2718532 RepID=UPI0014240E7F|nr:bifunctional diguanylate cyclase/phosphodiesterase [Aquabacterium sp. A08]NIC42724.1 EAL domain-containing protein [Aquabacterium sp. A08]